MNLRELAETLCTRLRAVELRAGSSFSVTG